VVLNQTNPRFKHFATAVRNISHLFTTAKKKVTEVASAVGLIHNKAEPILNKIDKTRNLKRFI
jgi:hypothetical protein